VRPKKKRVLRALRACGGRLLSSQKRTRAPPTFAPKTSIDARVVGARRVHAVVLASGKDAPRPGAGGAAGLTTAARSERRRHDARRTPVRVRRRHSSAAVARAGTKAHARGAAMRLQAQGRDPTTRTRRSVALGHRSVAGDRSDPSPRLTER
jgi:hypothetical protein